MCRKMDAKDSVPGPLCQYLIFIHRPFIHEPGKKEQLKGSHRQNLGQFEHQNIRTEGLGRWSISTVWAWGLTVSLKTWIKKAQCGHICLSSQHWGEKQASPGAQWPANLAYLMRSRPGRVSVSERGGTTKKNHTRGCPLPSTCMHTHACTSIHMHYRQVGMYVSVHVCMYECMYEYMYVNTL